MAPAETVPDSQRAPPYCAANQAEQEDLPADFSRSESVPRPRTAGPGLCAHASHTHYPAHFDQTLTYLPALPQNLTCSPRLTIKFDPDVISSAQKATGKGLARP